MQVIKTTIISLLSVLLLTSPVWAASWDMPTPYPDKTFHTVNIRQFADDVAKATDGKFTIQVHTAGSLFKHSEIKNAVRSGQVQIGEFFLSLLANENGIFGLDSVPFVATSYADAEKMWAAQKDAVAKLLDKQNMVPLFSVPWPPQALYVNKEINSVEDLRGVKFRANNPLQHQLASKLGMIPVQIEVPDLPQAFTTGRVEAMMTSPSTGVNSRSWDYVSNYYDVKAWVPKNIVVVNKRAWRKLDKATQKIVLEQAAIAEKRGWELSKEENITKLEELKQSKMTVHTEGLETIMSGLTKVGQEMAAEWKEQTGAEGAEILKNYESSK